MTITLTENENKIVHCCMTVNDHPTLLALCLGTGLSYREVTEAIANINEKCRKLNGVDAIHLGGTHDRALQPQLDADRSPTRSGIELSGCSKERYGALGRQRQAKKQDKQKKYQVDIDREREEAGLPADNSDEAILRRSFDSAPHTHRCTGHCDGTSRRFTGVCPACGGQMVPIE